MKRAVGILSTRFWFSDKAFYFKKVFNVLFILNVSFSNLFKSNEIVDGRNSEANIFCWVLFKGGIPVALLKLNYLVLNIFNTLLKDKIKLFYPGKTTYHRFFRLGRIKKLETEFIRKQ